MTLSVSIITILALVCSLAAAQEDPRPGIAMDSEGNLINRFNEGTAGELGIPCKGNCIGNVAGNNNGNNNINSSGNGNLNGNCEGNCMGNVIGNGNGNDNTNSNNNGNANGNCVGNCYHNFLGNGNGNRNKDVDNNGNKNGNCRGNCFHYNSGNFNGNDNSGSARSGSGDCVGNCIPQRPRLESVFRDASYDFRSTPMSCTDGTGWTYYIAENTQCNDITKVGHGHEINFACDEGAVFDRDICGCNRWWYVDILNTCRSGHGHWEVIN